MTKDELLAENERLGAEVAAHRVLLAAIRELATVPRPAEWASVEYVCDLEGRLNRLRAYAGHVDDITPDIMVPALHNRAKELREDAARAVRYKLPEPVITDSERTCDQANPGTGAHCHRGGDHGVHRDSDGGEWRTDAPEPEAADIAYDRTHPDPYRTWVNGEQPAGVTA